MSYILHILIMSGIYSILSIGLNITAGYTGVLSLAHASFFGIGAYTSSILMKDFGMPFLIALVSGGCLASVSSVAVGLPTLRLREDYFLIATLGFCEIIHSLFLNLESVTNGPRGIMGIPYPSIAGYKIDTGAEYLLLTLVVLSAAVFCSYRISKTQFGRVLKAIREDETLALSLGKNPVRYKTYSLMIGAFLAGLGGSLYAHFMNFIDPSSFTLNESIFIFCMIVLGGLGSITGSILGALVLVSLPELLRFVGLPDPVAATLRQVIYGVLLVVFMIFRPQGLLGGVRLRWRG